MIANLSFSHSVLALFALSIVSAIILKLLPRPSLDTDAYLEILRRHGVDIQSFPLAFSATTQSSYISQWPVEAGVLSDPDTTAIVLNFARFHNVRDIVAVLCSPPLRHIVKTALVWNNSPRTLSYKDFAGSGCPRGVLQIHNSPENLYFQARFLACAAARTPYCFLQDDDYFIAPSVLLALHARLHGAPPTHPGAIHLLPAHEHLTTALRATRAPRVHTSFAWLGHGTLVRRARAADFLALMRALGTSEDEMRMADNYFSVLANEVPEVWFDQGVEMGGGQAFTMGQEGHERNVRHITRALEYLDMITKCQGAACDRYPYVKLHARTSTARPGPAARAACLHTPCLLETNIAMLPSNLSHRGGSAVDMLRVEFRNVNTLGEAHMGNYITHPPSLAVDGRADTAFHSAGAARQGDFISLDMLIGSKEHRDVDFVFLVDGQTARILEVCTFAVSTDGNTWITSGVSALPCADTLMNAGSALRECPVRVRHDTKSDGGMRFFRAWLDNDVDESWIVHELWVRSVD